MCGSIFTQADLNVKKPDLFTLQFRVDRVIKQESRKSWPYCPESYTNNIIEVNPTQTKKHGMFIMLRRKTCPELYGSILNSYNALSEWSLFFSDDSVIFSYFKVSRVDKTGQLTSSRHSNSEKSHKRIQATSVA